MKKYTSVLFVLVFILVSFSINSNSTSALTVSLPAGCASTVGYSPLTGVKCDTPTNLSLPAGCTSTIGYSFITGVKCDNVILHGCPTGAVYSSLTGEKCPTGQFPPGCYSIKGFSEITGYRCDGSTKPPTVKYPSGCTSYVGYSSTTGMACDGRISLPTAPSPNPECSSYGYDTTTGYLCGCSSLSGYSSYNGKFCGDHPVVPKAADAYIKSVLNSARVQAELYYDSTGSYLGVCTSAAGVEKSVAQANEKGTKAKSPCDDSKTAWAANVKLKTSGAGYWCVDSTGFANSTDSDKGDALSCKRDYSTNPPHCSSSGYNPTTGFRCGCTSTVGYSSVDGQSCSAY